MASERKEEVRIWRDGPFQRKQRVVERAPSTQNILTSRLSQLIWLFTAVVMLLIGFRVILLMLVANSGNSFAQFIYDVSWIFVAPFNGLLASPALANGGVLEISSLVAIVVYVLLAFIVDRLLHIILRGWGSSRNVETVESEYRP